MRGTAPRRRARLFYHFACGVGLVTELRRRGIRHVHCHFDTASNIALAAHLYGEISYSFTAHASGDIYMQAPLLGLKVECARFVAAVCEYNRRYVDAATHRRYSDRVHTIYNGIDPAERGAAPAPAQHDPGELRLLSVGSLVAMKGHATLVEACAVLRGRGHRIRCEIIGEGHERNALEQLIVAAELEDIVRLRGAEPLSAVYAAMREADVFVHLSEVAADGYRDGFPTVILEAMASQLPVVSTWVSGIPEMVVPGETGFLVAERSPVAAAAALEQLHADPGLRRLMGTAGFRRVTERFSANRSADRLAELMAEAVGRPLPCDSFKAGSPAGAV